MFLFCVVSQLLKTPLSGSFLPGIRIIEFGFSLLALA